jgi:hypothetical protein
LEGSWITTSDRAVLELQFDAFVMNPDILMRFVLGAGGATFRLDGYSGNDPFDFRNKDYPYGLFDIQSDAAGPSANRSEFVIQDPTKAFGVEAMISKRLIAI